LPSQSFPSAGQGFAGQSYPQPQYPGQGFHQPIITEYKEDIFYSNRTKKYDSFHKHFFFENGQKAYDGFHNHAFYDNGTKAFDGFHGHVFYRNGKKAYDGFFYKASYENGEKLGSSGINYAAEGVSMNLNQNVDNFQIKLGQDFNLSVSISEEPESKKVYLYIGYQCALSKILS
jgi:hypothetical protein